MTPGCWLKVIMYLEDPVTGHLDTCSLAEMVPVLQVTPACFI
jgi:hypothetical protein